MSPKPSPSPSPDSKPESNLVGGVAVGEALEDGAGERVAVGGDEGVAECVGLLPWLGLGLGLGLGVAVRVLGSCAG